METTSTRREFFHQTGAIGSTALGSGVLWSTSTQARDQKLKLKETADLSVHEDLRADVVVRHGDIINKKGQRFGECCDFLKFIATDDPNRAMLWANHEYISTQVRYGATPPKVKTKAMVDAERRDVGGSLVELTRVDKKSPWRVKADSTLAFRIDATTPVPLTGPASDGGRVAEGTMGNCCGGYTPWETVLTCEENVADFYDPEIDKYGWVKYYKRPMRDYGWVVEVDPKTGKAKKHTALGRFAHEGATVTTNAAGKVVVYMGDDKRGEFLYKFVSEGAYDPKKPSAKLLETGTLFVANLDQHRWEKLSPENPKLGQHPSKKFETLAAILENTRAAGRVAGGTPLARPEGITIRKNGDVLVCLTENKDKGDLFGSVLRLKESGNDFASNSFAHDTWLKGGPENGFSCPDNIITGPNDVVWITTDLSGSKLGKGDYGFFKRNALIQVDESTPPKKKLRFFATAPDGAEFTGPCFGADGSELFVSVQHPGENSYSEPKTGLTTNWPFTKKAAKLPLSSVIVFRRADRRAFS